jgi:hypothetical protein
VAGHVCWVAPCSGPAALRLASHGPDRAPPAHHKQKPFNRSHYSSGCSFLFTDYSSALKTNGEVNRRAPRASLTPGGWRLWARGGADGARVTGVGFLVLRQSTLNTQLTLTAICHPKAIHGSKSNHEYYHSHVIILPIAAHSLACMENVCCGGEMTSVHVARPHIPRKRCRLLPPAAPALTKATARNAVGQLALSPEVQERGKWVKREGMPTWSTLQWGLGIE